MNTSTPAARVTLDRDIGIRLHRALFRSEPAPTAIAYLVEYPHALLGSGTARARCDRLRLYVSPEVLVVGALIATLVDPATYWPDLDLVIANTPERTLPHRRAAVDERAGQEGTL